MPKFGFGGPTYQSRSSAEDCEDCLNLYPERPEVPGAQGTWPLYGTPGKIILCMLSDGPAACVVSSNQIFAQADVTPIYYAVYGKTLFQIAVHYNVTTQQFVGTPTTIGTVDSKPIVGSSPQLFPAQILVLSSTLLFVVANGQAWVASYGAGVSAATVNSPGSGYVVGDTGYLIQANGFGAQYTVTAVVTQPAGAITSAISVGNGGAGYSVGDTGTIVAGNSDATYIITSVVTFPNGQILSTTDPPNTPGSGYAVGDTGTITTGNGDATYIVLQVGSLGGVFEWGLVNQGSGYAVAASVPTATGGAQPESGTGFLVDILAVSANHGAVTGVNVVAGGSGYAVANGVPTVPGGAQPGSGSGLTVNIPFVNINGGGVATFTITGGGGYQTGTNIPTQDGGAQPGDGSGFTVNITSVGAAAWSLVKQIIPNGALPSAYFIQSATYMDGYVIVSMAPNSPDPQRRQFFISDLQNPTNWNPLFVGTKESGTDPLMAVYAAFEVLIPFGTNGIEQWYDSGGLFVGDIPFTRIQGGGVLEGGLASTWTIAIVDGALCWIGSDNRGGIVAWTLKGLSPIRISNFAVEYQWRNYDVTASSAYAYQEGGHFFYVVHFPIPNTTWVADMTTLGPDGKPQWHRRSSWNGSNPQADIGRYHAYNFPIGHVVGDYQTNNLYLQSIDYLDENGVGIQRLRIPPPISNEQKRMLIQRVRMRISSGNVPSTGPGSNPVVNLRISHDSGKTWGNYLSEPMGSIGQYNYIVEWYVHSLNRACALEFTCNEPIPMGWVDGYIEVMLAQTQA